MAEENPTTPAAGDIRESLYNTVNQFMELSNIALGARSLIMNSDGGRTEEGAAAIYLLGNLSGMAQKFSTEADKSYLDSAAPGGAAYVSGAKACLAALRQACRLVEEGDDDKTTERYFEKRDAAIETILRAAGTIPSHAAGALATLAEFIVWEAQDAAMYDTQDFDPETTMTHAERLEKRSELAADCGV